MGSGYIRQASATIVTGNVITASDLNSEYNAIESAFNASSGHSHDGTTGEGPKISLSASVSGTLTVPNGGIGVATLTDGGVLLGSGTSAIRTTGVLSAGQILIGDGTTDPDIVSAFTSNLLKHENGGLEADVSAYSGLVKITAGATSAVAAPTGAVVGTSDTQTLTNKTISSASNTITLASTDLSDTSTLTYNADSDVSGNTWVLDEDNFASDSATKVPTQQSTKAYIQSLIIDEDSFATDSNTRVPTQQSVKAYVTSIAAGDVSGPASSTNDNFASFNGTGGKTIKDSGVSSASFATAGHNHTGVYQPLDSVLTNTTASFTTALAAEVAANTAKVTNATHTGDVTGATALTIANEAVTTAKLESDVQARLSGLPQTSKSTAYTLVLSDAGNHIFHPSADTTNRTWTIPANASVAYPIGTTITFINQDSAGVITISITSDTLRLAEEGTTGNRDLAANGIATAVKVTSTEWIISGVGLT